MAYYKRNSIGMSLSIIAIVAADGAIGRGGDQPFHISEDFRHFKQLTLGHPIIMGRKTFEALPKGALPGRRNIVITRNPDYKPEGAETAVSLDEAFAMTEGEEAFVIGGGHVYAAALDIVDTLYITEVNATVPDADTYFPAVDAEKWEVAEKGETLTDPRSGHSFCFLTYKRR